MILTGLDSRAARVLLGWSQEDLAGKASIGLASVKRFEAGTATTPVIRAVIEGALRKGGAGFFEAGETREGRRIKAGVVLFEEGG